MKSIKFNSKEYIINGDYSDREIIGMLWNIDTKSDMDYDVFYIHKNSTKQKISFSIYQKWMGMNYPNPFYPFVYHLDIKEIKEIKNDIYLV